MAEARLQIILEAVDQTKKAIGTASSGLKSFGDSATRLGKEFSLKLTAPIALAGTQALRTGISFDELRRTVLGTAKAGGAGAEALEELSKLSLEFGRKGVFSATQVMEAMLDMVRDGLTPAQIAGGQLAAVYDLAAATGEEMADAQIALSDTLQAFELRTDEASRVVDVFSGILFKTPAVLAEVGTTMKLAAPIASILGASIEDLGVAIGLMADSGIRGSMAGTTLRRGLLSLAAPTGMAEEAMASLGIPMEEAADLLDEVGEITDEDRKKIQDLGFSVFDAEGKFIGLENVIRLLRTSLRGATEETRIQTLSAIFGARAAAGWSKVILASDEAFEEMVDSVRRTGVASEIAQFRTEGLSGSVKKMQASLEVAAIALIESVSPAIQTLSGFLKQALDWFTALSPETKKWIVILAVLLAAIGPLLIIVGQVAIGLAALMTILPAIGGAMAVLVGPVGLIVVAIAGLIAISVLLIKNWDEMKDTLSRIWDDMINKFRQIVDDFKNSLNIIFNTVRSIFTSIADFLAGIIIIWASILEPAFMPLAEATIAIELKIREIFSAIRDFLALIWNSITATVSSIWQGIKLIIIGVAQSILEFFTPWFETLKSAFTTAFEAIKRAVQGPIEDIKRFIKDAIDFIKGPLDEIVEAVKTITKIGREVKGGGIPFIPGLQAGGIVTGPTIARLGERGPEAVIPLRRGALAAGGINVFITGNTISSELDLRHIAEKVGDEIIDRLKLHARLS